MAEADELKAANEALKSKVTALQQVKTIQGVVGYFHSCLSSSLVLATWFEQKVDIRKTRTRNGEVEIEIEREPFTRFLAFQTSFLFAY